MNAEIVMIGTELLLGQIVDTNAAHIGNVLAENGIGLFQKTTVGDNRRRIALVLEAALSRADVVLTSGGLGPTEDDLTREAVADVFGCPLEFRPELYEELLARFAFVRRAITENNKKQAMAPAGAVIIPNPNGTAPGLICGDERGEIICMPGVPRELYAMLSDSVIPYLKTKYALKESLYHRVLKVCGVGESWVDSKMGDLMATLENPTVGLLASPEWVRIRITARAESAAEAEALMDGVETQIQTRLPGLIMGRDGDTLEGVVDQQLTDRGWTLAVGESLTGGMMGQRLSALPARSFAGGLVVPVADRRHPDAAHFAAAARKCYQAECGLGMVTDPVERVVHGAFSSPSGETAWTMSYGRLDELTQLRTAVMCLERVRRFLTGASSEHQDAKV